MLGLTENLHLTEQRAQVAEDEKGAIDMGRLMGICTDPEHRGDREKILEIKAQGRCNTCYQRYYDRMRQAAARRNGRNSAALNDLRDGQNGEERKRRAMNYQKNGANKHSHEPKRRRMQAKRSDVDALVARLNSTGRALVVLRGNQILMICRGCNEIIGIVDVTFLPEDGSNS
jgi:hypothetical protein